MPMSKEQKFIDAASEVGPLPGFLFANPILAGFFAIIMCAVFGALMVLFLALLLGVVQALDLFEVLRWGAIAGLTIGAVALLVTLVRATFQRDEGRADRLQYVFGGILGIALLVAIDWLFLDTLRAWLGTIGPVIEPLV